MKLFCIVLLLVFSSAHGTHSDQGPCSDQNLAGCTPGWPDGTSSCNPSTGKFYHYYDTCMKKCSANCRLHPDDDSRSPACDDPSQRQNCVKFVGGCTNPKGCGVATFTITYLCWNPAEKITCKEFCCCDECQGQAGPPGPPGPALMWPILPYRNCDTAKGPLNDQACNDANLCSDDTAYFPDKNRCITKELAPARNWDDTQDYCSTLYAPSGHPLHLDTLNDIDILKALAAPDKVRIWTDLKIDATYTNVIHTWDDTVWQTVASAPWISNQPSGNDNCVSAGWMSWVNQYGWDDSNCALLLPVACEYQP